MYYPQVKLYWFKKTIDWGSRQHALLLKYLFAVLFKIELYIRCLFNKRESDYNVGFSWFTLNTIKLLLLLLLFVFPVLFKLSLKLALSFISNVRGVAENFYFYHIYPTPPLGQDMTQGQFFKRSLTGLISEFSFS